MESPPLTEQTAQLLIASLDNLAQAINNQKKDIDKIELWHIEHLIEYFNLSDSSIRKIVARPDFPQPIKPLPGMRSESLWHRDTVKTWAIKNQGRIIKGRQSQ